MLLEVDGAELKAEKAENAGGGEDVDGSGPLELLSWVMDERRAGPGTSIVRS